MTELFFADTYALIELIMGSKNYLPYLSKQLVTSQFNVMELYYYLLRNYNQQTADNDMAVLWEICAPITQNSIAEGMKLKFENAKEKLSYIDCVGWALAKEKGIKFLTGDEKFENKENVEFVKK